MSRKLSESLYDVNKASGGHATFGSGLIPGKNMKFKKFAIYAKLGPARVASSEQI